MKCLNRILALFLCAALLLSIVGCAQTPTETTASPATEPPTTAPAELDAQALYAAARAGLDNAADISLDLTITTYMTLGDDVFSEESSQILTYTGIGTDSLMICMDEQEFFSLHDPDERDSDVALTYAELWHNGTLYVDVSGFYQFSGPLDAEAASVRYTPVVLLDAACYNSITAEADGSDVLITFSDAAAPESWAIPRDAQFQSASGSARLNPDGAITQMQYSISYVYGPAQFTVEVVSSPMAQVQSIALPANAEGYTTISGIDAIPLYNYGLSILAQADSHSITCMESIFTQAAGAMRNQSQAATLHGRRDSTIAKFETNIYVMDYTTGESVEYEQEELFVDGKYTYTVDDESPVTYTDITWNDIRTYYMNYLVAGVPDMVNWLDAAVTDLGSLYLIEYTLTEDFGKEIQGNICDTLWNDSSFLMNLASDYRTAKGQGYISIDKYTGIITAAGYNYEGVHTIQGGEYVLTYQYDQTFESPSKGAYKEITDEMPDEAEPEIKATPLFYHVTGENGQEMWLLGTIHVGDERTAYLPEEIYNAFAASDALALECDSEAFDEQMEEDDALSEEVSGLYFYSDGTTVESLMEEEEYAQALKLLKATGSYNMNMPYAKPYLWSSSIEEFFLRQGNQLHRDQGVEERLQIWAEELDKDILEVESSLFQIRMLTGFSRDLQLQMLRDTLESSAREYWEGTYELYELWCAGDEAALRAELSDAVDMTDWTEEEIAEYESQKHLIEEYNKAMSYDRNDGMLEKAIEYLESGDVVFYAVGLAHLLNDVNGLVDTLREAGYTVEPVTYG